MAEQWRIGRGARTCFLSGEEIPPGEPFYSALVEDGDDFRRRDFAVASWPDADREGFFSYWRNKPRPERGESAKRKIDYERLLSFFDELADASEPRRRLFRYVLALILARRRILRLDATRRGADGETLVLFDRRIPGPIELGAPEATPGQLAEIEAALADLFDYDGPGDAT